MWDGRFTNNAWLQECAKPLTKQVWGNALHISPRDARDLGVVDGDIVRLSAGTRVLEAPVLVRPGQADKVIEATFGYGRSQAGAIGNGVGFNIHGWRTSDAPWVVAGTTLTHTGRTQNLLLTQHHFALEGDDKDLQPRVALADLARGEPLFGPPGRALPTLNPLRHDDDGLRLGRW